MQSLPAAEQQNAPTFPGIFSPTGDARLSRAAHQILEFPYDEGRLFAEAVAADGGEEAIEQVLVDPPESSEQILFPDAWRRDDQPAAVDQPSLPDGAEVWGPERSAPSSSCF